MLKPTFLLATLFCCQFLFAQIPLSFSGTPTLSGTAGTVGARYTYANVGNTGGITIKAVVEITSIDGAGLDNIDGPASSGGTDNAFQPVIYGSKPSGSCWSIRFRINFYNAANDNPISLSSFRASGIDIDGNGSSLREHNTFYYPYSYTVNNPTNLTIIGSYGVYEFRAPSTSYAGISLTQTNVAVTCTYTNRTSIEISIGSCCVGGACSVAANAGRQHSINFFDAVAYGSPMVTLPVQLLNFTANKNNGNVLLSWNTAEEINVSHFVVEKSEDGSTFTDIGTVPAAGSNNSYSYTDNMLSLSENIFYRLKTVDIDGKLSYSQIVRLSNESSSPSMLSIAPNPVTNKNFSATIRSDKKQQVNFRLISSEGKTLYSFQRMISEGVNVVPVEAGYKLNRGVYFLQCASAAGAVQTVKVVVQ